MIRTQTMMIIIRIAMMMMSKMTIVIMMSKITSYLDCRLDGEDRHHC